MLASAETGESRKHVSKAGVSLLLMAAAVFGGWRNERIPRKNRKEGRKGDLDLLKGRTTEGRAVAAKGKKAASRGW